MTKKNSIFEPDVTITETDVPMVDQAFNAFTEHGEPMHGQSSSDIRQTIRSTRQRKPSLYPDSGEHKN